MKRRTKFLGQLRRGREWGPAGPLFVSWPNITASGLSKDNLKTEAAAAHELGDLLWALIIISDRMSIDLKEALISTMAELKERLKY